jgi:hypothetical protein
LTVKTAKTLDGIALPEAGATEIAERNLALYRESGVRVRRGWDKYAPLDPDVNRHHFLDHLYRLTDTKTSETTYVSEPYRVWEFAELAKFEQEGWEVWIGQMPLWYPGRTTPIHFKRE